MRHFLGNKRKIKALHFWQTPNYFGLDFEFPPQNENFSENLTSVLTHKIL